MASGLTRFTVSLLATVLPASLLLAKQATLPAKFDTYAIIYRVLDHYRDEWYGDVSIAMENGVLVMWFGHTPSLVGHLTHWQFDSSLARWRDRELRADAYVTFDINPDGSVDRARMAAASPTVDLSFDFQDLVLRPVPQ
jgi:Domain of unknown function (DUF3471)